MTITPEGKIELTDGEEYCDHFALTGEPCEAEFCRAGKPKERK